MIECNTFSLSAASETERFVPLGQAASKQGLRFGFALDPHQLISNPEYAAFVAQQASIVVPENALKWEMVHPTPERYDFSQADIIATFARAHNITMRGHTFCWHRSLPFWVSRKTARLDIKTTLIDHIHQVAGRYKGLIQSWDVVNEVMNPGDGLPGGWRDSFWYRALGPSYVAIACRAAREADPDAVLCYNEYGLEGDGNAGRIKRANVLALLQNLQQQRAPIGALGIQSHLRAGKSDSFGPELARFILDVKALGLAVYITELDVDDSLLDPSTSDGIVAGVYKRYLDLVLGTGAVSTVMTWGVWDTPHYTAATPGQTGPMARRPLVFGPDGALKDASWATAHCLLRAARPSLVGNIHSRIQVDLHTCSTI